MIYKEYEDLTTIGVQNQEEVSFDNIVEAILLKPSNIIYCEDGGKLCGIISMGDVARASCAERKSVPFNKRFTRVRMGEHMRARNIFRDRKSINALPIIDDEDRLVGEYSRWDELLKIKYSFFAHKLYCSKIALVKPRRVSAERWEIFHLFYKHLLSWNMDVKCIEYAEVPDYVEYADRILFIDEDELRAMDSLLTFIWKRGVEREKLITYTMFITEEVYYEMLNEHLRFLDKNGVRILNLYFSETKYKQRLRREITEKFSKLGKNVSNKMPTEMLGDFFSELNEKEYVEEIANIRYSVETKSGTGKLKDCLGKYYNVTDGERKTEGQPDFSCKKVYFYGPCFVYGHYVEDRYTIESYLQRHFNKEGTVIGVVNYGSPSYSGHVGLMLARILDTPLKQGDIVVVVSDNKRMKDVCNLDLSKCLEVQRVNAAWMVDCPLHCNHKVNSVYADAIFNELKVILIESGEKQGELIKWNNSFVNMQPIYIYISAIFADFNSVLYDKVGSIVMNCNPFTYGHRYLIEQALKVVDFLIIFVVEENKSVFSFAERFAMVCEGTVDLENVKVVPSGPFILSQTTFPEYFIKEPDEDIVENVENDITIFAEKIAPYLNIHYRFVGEEPDDVVTKEYNLAMKRILPEKGINVIEIPRKEQDNRCISASWVRKCLEENDLEEVKRLVPKSTRKILFGNGERRLDKKG